MNLCYRAGFRKLAVGEMATGRDWLFEWSSCKSVCGYPNDFIENYRVRKSGREDLG
jgi:hypothetical protein